MEEKESLSPVSNDNNWYSFLRPCWCMIAIFCEGKNSGSLTLLWTYGPVSLLAGVVSTSVFGFLSNLTHFCRLTMQKHCSRLLVVCLLVEFSLYLLDVRVVLCALTLSVFFINVFFVRGKEQKTWMLITGNYGIITGNEGKITGNYGKITGNEGKITGNYGKSREMDGKIAVKYRKLREIYGKFRKIRKIMRNHKNYEKSQKLRAMTEIIWGTYDKQCQLTNIFFFFSAMKRYIGRCKSIFRSFKTPPSRNKSKTSESLSVEKSTVDVAMPSASDKVIHDELSIPWMRRVDILDYSGINFWSNY